MTTKTKKLIELAERAKGVEGSEKWTRLVEFEPDGMLLFKEANELIISEDGQLYLDGPGLPVTLKGPLLPHNPIDPMNPAACLRRVGTIGVHWVFQHPNGENEDILSLALSCAGPDYPPIMHGWPMVQEYEDFMEALLNLYDLSISEGGEWAKAWDRAMTQEGE